LVQTIRRHKDRTRAVRWEQGLLKISLAAALAAVLLFNSVAILRAQQADEANELNKRVIELYNAG
jgi:hypothetical protein